MIKRTKYLNLKVIATCLKQVYQGIYKDATTRLFIFWTSDGYKQYGCYNLDCPGFIQTNTEIAIGGSLSPTSQVDGSQYEMTILIWKVFL
ncbi:putative neprosin [Helianthus annuus]|nr:putative neprosin [Helianthus annuus]KAJ0783608.1 putative neprosin [Helianthus annuus]